MKKPRIMIVEDESENHFRAVFQNAAIGIAISDSGGNIITTNQAFQKVLGYSAEELVGKSHLEMIHPDDITETEKLSKSLFGDATQNFQIEKRYICKNQNIIWGRLTVSPIQSSDPNIQHTVGVLEDITEHKKMQEDIIINQKTAGLGTLAAGLAHEMNSPLQVITGYSESLLRWLKKQESKPERLENDIAAIHRNAWRLADIVKSLQVYASPICRNMEFNDINKLINDSLLFAEHESTIIGSIKISKNLSPDLPAVYCSGCDITQALINIIENACEAMTGDGILTVSSEYDPDQKLVIISISDTGAGMTEEIQGKIFDPFFTTKTYGEGTGLGLAVVQGIVTSHGGKIMVNSKPHSGSTFIMYLPAVTEKDPSTPE